MQNVHPQYRPVAFRDTSTGDIFVTRSTAATAATIEHEGERLPLVDIDVSSASHPAFIGRQRSVAASTQIDRFKARYARFSAPATRPE